MTSILLQSGFNFLQTLKDFVLKFDNSKYFDEDLEKVWICHKICPSSLNFEKISGNKNYENLCGSLKSRIDNKSEKSQTLALKIFNKIFHSFDCNLTTYILTECYLFYKWNVNSFEVLLDQNIVHEKISYLKSKQLTNFQKTNVEILNKYLDSNILFNNSCNSKIRRKNCTKLLDSKKHKGVTQKSIKKAIDNIEPYFDIQFHSNCLAQETFTINKILYDTKQRPQWPKTHIISTQNVNSLLTFIIEIPSPPYNNYKKKLLSECEKWIKYKEIVEEFLHNHSVVEKNNGYGRILKRHLKKAKNFSGKLMPVSKSIVYTYIFDIIRKVVPISLFGRTSLRKKIFKQLCKILSSHKKENFIWQPVLQILVKNKHLLNWCKEINDHIIELIMILKTFKFLILEFIFIILKNNFYITENGSSGNNIHFYRKNNMESVSANFLNSLLYYQQIKRYKKCDHDPFFIERKWLETGIIDEKDLKNKARKIMSSNFEFKQPLAKVRFLPKNSHSDSLRIITSVFPRKENSSPHSPEIQQLELIFKNQAKIRKEKLFHTKIFLDYLIEMNGLGMELNLHHPKLEVIWKEIMNLKKKFGQLYYVKTDIADAFDSILHSKLMEILKEKVVEIGNEKIQLKNIRQWKIRNRKVFEEEKLSFSDRPKENAVLINVSVFQGKKKLPEYQVSEFLRILSQIILEQKVMIKGKIFKLNNGLPQGSAGRFSHQLCNLYYSSMDKIWFRIFNDENCILLRVVDDYLLVTSNKAQARAFLFLVRAGIKDFNARFNTNKLQSNLIDEKIDEVIYLGIIFNFKHLSLKPNYSQYTKKTVLSTMKLSDQSGNNHFNKNYFLEKSFENELIKISKLTN